MGLTAGLTCIQDTLLVTEARAEAQAGDGRQLGSSLLSSRAPSRQIRQDFVSCCGAVKTKDRLASLPMECRSRPVVCPLQSWHCNADGQQVCGSVNMHRAGVVGRDVTASLAANECEAPRVGGRLHHAQHAVTPAFPVPVRGPNFNS